MRHFCASAYIINPENKKVLLVRHKKYNKWLQPGGHIEDNEIPEEAAIREVYEETGIKATLIGEHFPREDDLIRPLAVQCNRKDNGDKMIDMVYVGKPNNPENHLKMSSESNDVGWFSRHELDEMPVFPDVKISLDYILRNYFGENNE